MAFNANNMTRATASGNGGAPSVWAYGSSTDDFATIAASGYFNFFAANFTIKDWIIIQATDSTLAVQVTAVTPNVTVAVISNFSDALNDGDIFVGNASNIATPVAMSGDATLSNTGVLTVGKALDGGNAVNTAAGSVLGALPVLHVVALPGGATSTVGIVLTNKTTVIDAWVQLNGAGSASDTYQVKNGSTAITNAMDGNAVDKTIVRAGTIDDAQATINASGTLNVTQTDGGGSDSPPATAFILGWHVA